MERLWHKRAEIATNRMILNERVSIYEACVCYKRKPIHDIDREPKGTLVMSNKQFVQYTLSLL